MLKKAFTFIEISIALLIIGAILGTVMIGYSVTQKAKLDSVFRDFQSFEKMTNEFRDKYGFLPGDLPDISVLPSTISGSTAAGNGNSVLDNAEYLQFFHHLYLAGYLNQRITILGPGHSIASEGVAGTYPGSKLTSTGYQPLPYNAATSADSNGIILSLFRAFAVESFSVQYTPLYPDDAAYLDSKYDDGNPTTGKIRSNCSYNENSKVLNCGIFYQITFESKALSSASALGLCGGVTPLGVTTKWNICNHSTNGYRLHACSGSTTAPTLQLVNSSWCSSKPVSGGFSGQARYAPYSYTHAGITNQNAINSGLWQFSTSPIISPNPVLLCYAGGQSIPTTQGPDVVGLKFSGGFSNQTCPVSNWNYTAGVGHNPTSCPGGVDYGDINPSATVVNPGTRYTSNISPSTIEACTIPLDTSSTGTFRAVGNTWIASNFETGCTDGDTRTVACPYPETGAVTDACYNNRWQTISQTCKTITCGGAPIGSTRRAMGKTCPVSANVGLSMGTPLEVCDVDGNWKYSTYNCTP